MHSKKFLPYLFSAVLLALLTQQLSQSQETNRTPGKIYPHRWVYVRNSLNSDAQLTAFENVARTAAAHGLNGILLAGGLDSFDLRPPEYAVRLQKAKTIAETLRMEIIPAVFGPGYGGAILAHDRNLAAGLPVRGALFLAGASEAKFQQDSPEGLGDLGLGALEFDMSKKPARVVKEIRVRPYRSYRLRMRVKTESIAPRTLFSIRAIIGNNRDMARFEPELPATGDWKEYTGAFNSWFSDRVTLQIGSGERGSGRYWVDRLSVEEVGLMNVVRRNGTPVVVRDEKTATVFEEGRDYEVISDPNLTFKWDHDMPVIRLMKNTRIAPGTRLRVDYFHGTTVYRDQVNVCMSEDKLYEIWGAQIPLIEKHLTPKRYFFNMDEIRIGGHCEACKKRKLSMAQILGDNVTRAYNLVRKQNPKAEIFIWSDMFDPNHNARNEYYMVDGDYTGSWNYIPKDMVIACWYHTRRDASLAHFSGLGFRTFAGAYYDADTLENPKGWLESLDRTPHAIGIMYTTWQQKYGLLADFGDLVSKR
ncbi:MAG: hypothetical protein JNL98_06610 [Bryobacterales bacterium]|nr:hypothetical protein [Bryobacterales bacterium]